MKKLFGLFAFFGLLMLGVSNYAVAQDAATDSTATEATVDSTAAAVEEPVTEEVATTEEPAELTMHQQIKQKFIEGGAMFMGFVLISLIFGLAVSIERVIYLNLATTNSKKLLSSVEQALQTGGVDAAKEVCRSTRGPVASIFYQGLERAHEGIDMVEKSVVAYGSVQMGRLESGLPWIALFISLGPMLGFLGTVVGMIQAFDAIQVAGDISPTLVASGIKVALITTVGGLIVAMILQVLYNYLLSKIDSIVNSMEDDSITLIDLLVKYTKK